MPTMSLRRSLQCVVLMPDLQPPSDAVVGASEIVFCNAAEKVCVRDLP